MAVANTWAFEGESYSLSTVPKPESKVVLYAKAEVLGTLKLEEVIEGLSQAATLIYIAYNGVAGFGNLQAALLKIHDRFGVTCGNSDLALQYFATQSKKVQDTLVDAVELMLMEEFGAACEMLQSCKDQARDLEKRAQDMANQFDSLAADTVQVIGEVEIAKGLEETKKKELQKSLNDMKASLEEAKVQLEGMTKQREKLEKLYQEAKEEAAKADDKAFALSLTSAILAPIGAAVGAIAGAYINPIGTAANQVGNQVKSILPPTPGTTQADAIKEKTQKEKELEVAIKELETKSAETVEAKEDLKVAEQELEAAKTETNKARTAYEDMIKTSGGDAQQKLALQNAEIEAQKAAKTAVEMVQQAAKEKEAFDAEADAEKKESLKAVYESAKANAEKAQKLATELDNKAADARVTLGNSELNQLRATLKTKEEVEALKFNRRMECFRKVIRSEAQEKKAKDTHALKKSALDALAAALGEASKQLAQMGDNYNKIAVELRQEKMKYLDMVLTAEKEEAKNQGLIAKYNLQIANQTKDSQDVDIVIASLFLASGALKRVASTFRLTSQFWKQMEAACNNLASNNVDKNLKIWDKLSSEKKKLFLEKDSFKEQIVRFYAGWRALELICKEYAARASVVKIEVYNNFKKNLSTEEARKEAQRVGNELVEKTEKSRAQVDSKIKAILDEKQEVEKEVVPKVSA